MEYQVKVYDPNDRKARIDKEKSSSSRNERFFFRDQETVLKVIRLPIDFLIYRMRNGRTRVAQLEYSQKQRLSLDFFLKGEENQSAQQVQHKILLEMAKDRKGPIYQELERVKTQMENLLITGKGVVVNGNRRLATMRALYSIESTDFASYSHVDCVVLPEETTDRDLEIIETALQMVPETKLDYGWIERRMKIRYHVEELKIPIPQVQDMYRFRKEEDVTKEIQQLYLVEEYLDKYLGKPGAYREVEYSEEIFARLYTELLGKSGQEAEMKRLLGFLLIKEAGNLGGRVYNYRVIFGKDSDKVLSTLAREKGVKLAEQPTTPKIDSTYSDDDPLSGLTGTAPYLYAPLKSLLSDASKSKEIADEVVSISNSLEFERKEDGLRKTGLRNIEQANRLLHEVDLSISDVETYPQMLAQLQAINAIVAKLKGDISKSQGS